VPPCIVLSLLFNLWNKDNIKQGHPDNVFKCSLDKVCQKDVSRSFKDVEVLLRYIIVIYRMRHQNPDKSNNFFKQNVFNEKLNITKIFFTWHLGKHNSHYSIYPLLVWMTASILGLKCSHTCCNVTLPMSMNAASIAIFNDIT